MGEKKEQKKEAEDELELEENESVLEILRQFWNRYKTETSSKLKIIDGFLLYCLLITWVQVLYFGIAGDYPRNSLLSGLASSVGSFTITCNPLHSQSLVCFRKQFNPDTKYMQISDERTFWEYLICMIVLFLTVVNFIG